MKIYISQLIDYNDIKKIVLDYNVNVELINYSIAENLDDLNKAKTYDKDIFTLETDFGVHGPFFDLMPASYDSLIKEVTMKRFNQAYDIAKKVNAKHIIFHTGYLKDIYYYEGWLENSITFWQEFLQDKDDSIQIYLENVFEDEYDSMFQLFETINNPIFNMCFDLGHANVRSQHSLIDLLTKFKKYIKHLHIHNNDGIKDLHKSILKGSIDYVQIFNHLNNLDIKPDITLEMNNVEDIIESLNFIKSIKKR